MSAPPVAVPIVKTIRPQVSLCLISLHGIGKARDLRVPVVSDEAEREPGQLAALMGCVFNNGFVIDST